MSVWIRLWRVPMFSSAPSVRNAAQQPAANGSADSGRPSTVVPVGILGGPPTLLAPARAVPNPSPQYPPQQAAPPKASAANGVKGQSSGQGQGRGAQKKGGNAKGGGNVGGGAANSAVMLGQLFGAAAGMPAKSLPPMPPMPHGTNSISECTSSSPRRNHTPARTHAHTHGATTYTRTYGATTHTHAHAHAHAHARTQHTTAPLPPGF